MVTNHAARLREIAGTLEGMSPETRPMLIEAADEIDSMREYIEKYAWKRCDNFGSDRFGDYYCPSCLQYKGKEHKLYCDRPGVEEDK